MVFFPGKDWGCLITKWLQPAAAGQSCVLSGRLVSIQGQSSQDGADRRAAGGHRAKGPELRQQIFCGFLKCLLIVHVLLAASVSVCGPVLVRWCHPCVHNRQLLLHGFCLASVAAACDSCSPLRWHTVFQLGKHNRSQKQGQCYSEGFLDIDADP